MGEREKEAQRRHELAMKELELQSANVEVNSDSIKSAAKLPKLPTFADGKDDLDSYLQRFERFAKNNNWDQSTWSTSLSALLTGRALDVYSRLSETAAVDYKQLDRYLTRWVELSKTEKTYEGISDLFIKEQFIHSCPEDLAIYLRQRNLENLEELTKTAEQFLVAHEKKLSSSSKSHNKLKVLSKGMNSPDSSKESTHEKRIQCFNCKGYGHKASECRKPARQEPRAENRCFLCDHIMPDIVRFLGVRTVPLKQVLLNMVVVRLVVSGRA
jgi:hypothetical protein